MKKYGIRYHSKIKDDIKTLDASVKKKIKTAIENKLSSEPFIYGQRLKGTVKDLWKLRVGRYRVIYIIDDETKMVYILAIAHRKDACKS